jgi:hypothetical protein
MIEYRTREIQGKLYITLFIHICHTYAFFVILFVVLGRVVRVSQSIGERKIVHLLSSVGRHIIVKAYFFVHD